MTGREAKGNRLQVMEMWSFWLMSVSMIFITLFLTGAGIVQVYLQRYSDAPQAFMVVQEKITLFYWMREVSGVVFLIGAVLFILSFLLPDKEDAILVKSV